MNEYIVVYSYDGTFNYTYSIRVLANNYGEVEKNIKEVFEKGVEMYEDEWDEIIENKWYFIDTPDETCYKIGE